MYNRLLVAMAGLVDHFGVTRMCVFMGHEQPAFKPVLPSALAQLLARSILLVKMWDMPLALIDDFVRVRDVVKEGVKFELRVMYCSDSATSRMSLVVTDMVDTVHYCYIDWLFDYLKHYLLPDEVQSYLQLEQRLVAVDIVLWSPRLWAAW